MAVPLTPLKKFQCDYADCYNSFDTEYQMQCHKNESSLHPFYCKKCRYNAIDWDDSLAHKVESMAYWLYGPGMHEKKKSFKHIVCEFCGMEFGSLGGRDIHKKREHQADHQIKCEGFARVWNPKKGTYETDSCGEIFGRASQYMRHIEHGLCRFIKRAQIETERQQKHIVSEIMKNPDKFAQSLRENPSLMNGSAKLAILANTEDLDDSDDEEQDDGGAQIMELDDTIQATTFHPLEPSRQNLRYKERAVLPRESQTVKAPKTLLDHAPENLDSIMQNLSISETQSTQIESSASFTTQNSVLSSVWGTGNSSKILFADAKPNPRVERNWQAIQASHDRSRREDEKSNFMYSRFWDPSDSDYSPDLFRTGNLDRYQCPFPECEAEYDISNDIAAHLRNCHIEVGKQCIGCHREFKDLTALVSHFEASARGGKCRVARSDGFAKVLDEATGGFLSATKVAEEKIWGYGENEDWGKPAGVKSHEYKAHLPSRALEGQW